MNREHVVTMLRSAAPDLAQEFGLNSLAIFGSVARGEAEPGSDVDLLVTITPEAKVTLFTLARLQTRLEELLGASVDVVEDHPRLPRSLRASIEQELLRVA